MSILTFGEALGVLRSPTSLAHTQGMELGIGGAEVNVAIGLTRLGASVTWLGRVGDDGLGRRISRELRAEGVSTVVITDPNPTGLLLKDRDALGRTHVSYYRSGSAGSHLRVDDLDQIRWEDLQLLHLTGITPALGAAAAQTVRTAMQRARANEVLVSFDVNHRAKLWDRGTAAIEYRSLLPLVDLLFAGMEEAALLSDALSDDPMAAAAHLLDLGPREVVLKMGENGAVAATRQETLRVKAMRTAVVDTVGAGDAFVAGYLAERINDLPLPERLATATMMGAAACRHHGDWEGTPTRAELAAPCSDPVIR